MDRSKINDVLDLLKSHYNNTTTALDYKSPFQLLISTMLAAQSTDKRVNIVTHDLFRDFPDAHYFLKLDQAELEDKIKTVGLYKSKARHILATCRILVDEYDGQIPHDRDKLMQLPGVGRKTANVVLSLISDFKAIAVDTHVFRVSNRIGLAESGNVLRTEEDLMKNIPVAEWSAAHHWLIWHGRKICKARKPLCESCFLLDICQYYKNQYLKVDK